MAGGLWQIVPAPRQARLVFKGRQRETKGDKGRQRETKGDKGRQGQTKGDKGRQGETKGDKGRQVMYSNWFLIDFNWS